MSKHSVQIDDNVYQNVKEYCEINNLKLGPYISSLISRGLNEDKYGDAPFLRPKKKQTNEFLSATALADIINSRKQDIVIKDDIVSVETNEFNGKETYTIPVKEEVVMEQKVEKEVIEETKPVVKRRKIK